MLAVETEGLVRDFGSVRALDCLDLQVEPGQIFGFLGPNGAGKTTTIRLLLDLIRPTSGHARVLGFDCQRQSLEVRRRCGYLPGELHLYEGLSGKDYLDFFASLRPGQLDLAYLDVDQRVDDTAHVLAYVGGHVEVTVARLVRRVGAVKPGGVALEPVALEEREDSAQELLEAGQKTSTPSSSRAARPSTSSSSSTKAPSTPSTSTPPTSSAPTAPSPKKPSASSAKP